MDISSDRFFYFLQILAVGNAVPFVRVPEDAHRRAARIHRFRDDAGDKELVLHEVGFREEFRVVLFENVENIGRKPPKVHGYGRIAGQNNPFALFFDTAVGRDFRDFRHFFKKPVFRLADPARNRAVFA